MKVCKYCNGTGKVQPVKGEYQEFKFMGCKLGGFLHGSLCKKCSGTGKRFK